MKLTLTFLLLSAPLAAAQCLRTYPETLTFDTREECSYDKVFTYVKKKARNLKRKGFGCLSPEEELGDMLGLDPTNVESMRAKIGNICDEARSHSRTDDNFAIHFEEVELIGSDDADTISRFIKEFYDGGTFFNEEIQQRGGGDLFSLSRDTLGIQNFYTRSARKNIVRWPATSISNFDTCEINAAMCCWVQDRQADDNNGNCESPYPNAYIGSEDLWTPDSCVDKDPADNTDICYVDMSRSPKSNHVIEGAVIYDDKAGVREGDAHCHGFAWGDDQYSDSHRYRGNNLFFVSMYDHLRERGYVREVPGAPMCGCIEQMPTVTRSDCTELEIREVFNFVYEPNALTFRATITDARVEFNACQGLNGNNNNLQAYYEKLVADGEVDPDRSTTKIDKFLVGEDNCAPAITDLLKEYHIKSL